MKLKANPFSFILRKSKMCQADMTEHLLSLDHPRAQKQEQGRRAFSLLNSETKHAKRKGSQE